MLKHIHKTILNRLGFDLIRIPGFRVERPSFLITGESDCNLPEVHMLWVDGNLSNLEKISIISFINNGFKVKLWTYGGVLGVPDGITQHDARTVLPENRIFKYKNGSYAGFANLFRYAVLSKFGGLWADTDVICLVSASQFSTFSNRGFFVSERGNGSLTVNNNLIYHPEPARGDLIDLAFAVTNHFSPEKLDWGDCGPRLLNSLVLTYPKLAPSIMEPNFANPIDWWNCPNALFSEGSTLTADTWFLHCYNETWRRAGVEKNGAFNSNSIYGEIYKKYKNYM